MQAAERVGIAALVLLAVALTASVAGAGVRIEVATGVPDQQDKIAVDVILHGDGNDIGGFQNDIVFDSDVVRLDSVADCKINPAISAFPAGSGNAPFCADDPTIGACKTLVRGLTSCAEEQAPRGCTTEDPRYLRLRAIVAAIEVPNTNSIPDGVAYTCTFTVVKRELLPVQLFNTNIVVANTLGMRLPSVGEHGGVCVDDEGGLRCASPRAIDEGCSIDFECASGNCDICCDHQFNGICAAPRTPTPTPTRTSTRTPVSTRTATGTRPPTATRTATLSPTVTDTPTPKSIGDPCLYVGECAANLSCNRSDGGVCCTSISCPQGMACNVPGFEGYCVRGVTPTPTTPALDDIVVTIGSATPDADGFAEVAVSLRGEAYFLGGMQNDILFDNTAISLDPGDCQIAPAIGLFPKGPDATSCLDDTTIGPCKNLSKALAQCDAEPHPQICLESAAPNISVFRAIVAATAAPNNNVIPDGVVYTCRFRVSDPTRLPVVLHNSNAVVSNPTGTRLPHAMTIDGRIDPPAAAPGATGTSCFGSADCDSRNCVDGVCCSDNSCEEGKSCAVSGSRGECAALRLQGEGCDLGTDCETGNCDLHRDSAASIYRGACGAPRTATPLAGECSRGRDCDSGNCVDQFCCAEGGCPSGQFCNSGECALPAEPGAACAADEQCALGLCVDGACCVTGDCPEGQSCSVPTLEGVCHEPFRLGSICTLDSQCPSGFCTNNVCCKSESCPSGFVCSWSVEPGECVEAASEHDGPGRPPAGDSATPTPYAPGLPTAEATRTLPGTPLPTLQGPRTPAPTAAGTSFRGGSDDGCSMMPRDSSNRAIWILAPAVFLILVSRRRFQMQ